MMATLSNGGIAELLAREAEKTDGQVRMALKRAARLAFLWREEASELVAAKRSLTELPAVGPFVEKRILTWLDHPPEPLDPPEERAGFITLAQSRKRLSRAPGWRKKYRGDLQMHSQWSDGASSIEQLAAQARILGYEYIAITDHTKGLKIAGGIDERALARQAMEINELNARFKSTKIRFRVLRSAELNLNPRGEGDMEPQALAKLDLVVGSFHSALRSTTDQTARYIAALNNPEVHILGHPRGRIYNYRLGLRADWRRVFATAAALDKAVEVDCYPDRQDIDVALLKIAREEGARIAIDTDAHSPEQLAFVDLGLAATLKAKIPPDRIVNFLPPEELLAWATSVRVRTLRAL